MLLFFFGLDSYRIQKESLSERERFFGRGAFQSVRKFDASERGVFSWKEFAESVRDEGLFSEKRCVIVQNICSLLEDEKERCKKWLEGENNPKGKTSVLCILEETKPDKRTIFFKVVQKSSQWKEFPFLSPNEFLEQACAMALEKFPNFTWEGQSIHLLVQGCGNDLYRLENEMEKLVAHAGEIKKVTEQDVQLLCSFGVYDEIFQALDALSRGDKRKALQFFWRQVRKGKHPIYLLTMCAYQVRILLLVGEYLEKGISQPAIVAREAKIHPFVAQKTIACMRNFGADRARKAFQLLGRLDVAVKTGKMDSGLALEEFVLRL